jgi:uncharacterized protein YbaR (Trm112 family)
MIHGKCPNCKTPATLAENQKKFTCEACNKVYGVRWHSPTEPELLEAKRRCPVCETPLLVPAKGNTLTCTNCGEPLRIRRDDGVTLETIGAVAPPADQISGYKAWITASKFFRNVGYLFLFAGGATAIIMEDFTRLPVIVLLLVAVALLGVHFILLRPTVQEKRQQAIEQAAQIYELSPRFQRALFTGKVDLTDRRGKQILDLYHSAGEDAAVAVANKQVAIGMTEGMVRLTLGAPTKILAKSKGMSAWQTSTPTLASQYHQRMLWVYKTAPKRKVWFKGGRVARAQEGNAYINKSINVA